MGRMTKEEAKEIAKQIVEHGRKHGIPAKRKPKK